MSVKSAGLMTLKNHTSVSDYSGWWIWMHDIYPSNPSDGNWYVLAAGLPSLTKPLVLAPGLSVRPLS